MNLRTALLVARVVTLCCSPAAVSMAAAAASPAPTLIRLETGPLDTPTPMTEATDACVARVNAGDFDAATPACDSAVSIARRSREEPGSVLFTARSADEDLAIAYNNRAVLHYVTRRLALAKSDAKQAMSASRLTAIASTAAAIEAALQRVANADD